MAANDVIQTIKHKEKPCMDGLTGFLDAVKAVFPDTHIQHCIVHMIRNSTKFVSYPDLKAVCQDLKEVYPAINAESGLE